MCLTANLCLIIVVYSSSLTLVCDAGPHVCGCFWMNAFISQKFSEARQLTLVHRLLGCLQCVLCSYRFTVNVNKPGEYAEREVCVGDVHAWPDPIYHSFLQQVIIVHFRAHFFHSVHQYAPKSWISLCLWRAWVSPYHLDRTVFYGGPGKAKSGWL